MPTSTTDDRSLWLYVVELDDAVGPRRHPERPNLYVGVSTMDPTERLRLDRRPSARPKKGVREHGLRTRPDLVPSTAAMTRPRAREQRAALIAELTAAGFTVNGNRTVWSCYVIELSDEVGPRADLDLPWVYVGQSTLDPPTRFEQHRSGARNAKGQRLYSKWPHRFGVRLRPDLYGDEPVHFTKQDAERAEAGLAQRLEYRGFSVKGGH